MMSSLVLQLSVGVNPPSDQAELKALLDGELRLLNDWLVSQGASPLASFEDAMLRTYLVQKLNGSLDSQMSREGVDSMVTQGASTDPTSAA